MTPEWREAAVKWRNQWFEMLSANMTNLPERGAR